eukprot:3975122-Prymnesium_polylepis.1
MMCLDCDFGCEPLACFACVRGWARVVCVRVGPVCPLSCRVPRPGLGLLSVRSRRRRRRRYARTGLLRASWL